MGPRQITGCSSGTKKPIDRQRTPWTTGGTRRSSTATGPRVTPSILGTEKPYTSASSNPTSWPRAARATARFTVTDDLPDAALARRDPHHPGARARRHEPVGPARLVPERCRWPTGTVPVAVGAAARGDRLHGLATGAERQPAVELLRAPRRSWWRARPSPRPPRGRRPPPGPPGRPARRRRATPPRAAPPPPRPGGAPPARTAPSRAPPGRGAAWGPPRPRRRRAHRHRWGPQAPLSERVRRRDQGLRRAQPVDYWCAIRARSRWERPRRSPVLGRGGRGDLGVR